MFLSRKNRRSFFLLLVVTAIVMIGMLYFGIRLKGYRPGNNVLWSDSGTGLAFDRYAQAYTDGFFSVEGDHSGVGLTIELAINPQIPERAGFRFLVLVHDGDEERQLVIGQWRSSLVIMNGGDYSNKLRNPKIYLELDSQQAKKEAETHFISVVSNAKGTRVFLDGKLKKRSRALVLQYPQDRAAARLVVGNSLRAKHSWIGSISGLAFYDRGLSDEAVRQHYHQWRSARSFSGFIAEDPRLLYAFDEGQGQRVYNKIGNGLDLNVPEWMKVLQTEVLSWPRWEMIDRPGGIEDMLVNFAGFMPLGFLLITLSSTLEGIGRRRALLAAMLVVFSFSLGIEIIQVWIPSRDSSMLDLTLNTLGGGIGALFFVKGKGPHMGRME